MKVVIDTNVLMSGLFFGGVPGRILAGWRRGLLTMVVSTPILEEYWRTADRLSGRFSAVDPTPFLNLISVHAVVVDAPTFDSAICDDPDDDKFLECALTARAKAIATGDKALLRLSPFLGIPILKPRAFADRFLAL
jgi:putative PIN family toxin of toxin-antitoxin system